jgi:hypothetical protein
MTIVEREPSNAPFRGQHPRTLRGFGPLAGNCASPARRGLPDGWHNLYTEAPAPPGGRRPELGKSEFGGARTLYRKDGTPQPHDRRPNRDGAE